jgi:hypothetical protein
MAGKKGRLTASGIYQMIKDRGSAIGLPIFTPPATAYALALLAGQWVRQRGCWQLTP